METTAADFIGPLILPTIIQVVVTIWLVVPLARRFKMYVPVWVILNLIPVVGLISLTIFGWAVMLVMARKIEMLERGNSSPGTEVGLGGGGGPQ